MQMILKCLVNDCLNPSKGGDIINRKIIFLLMKTLIIHLVW